MTDLLVTGLFLQAIRSQNCAGKPTLEPVLVNHVTEADSDETKEDISFLIFLLLINRMESSIPSKNTLIVALKY